MLVLLRAVSGVVQQQMPPSKISCFFYGYKSGSAMKPQVRRIFLLVLLIFLGISTLLGVGVILTDMRSELSIQLLLTSITIACANLFFFISSFALEKRKIAFLGYIGMGCSMLAALTCLLDIWLIETFISLSPAYHNFIENLARFTGTIISWGVIIPICSLLLFPNLKSVARFIRNCTVIICLTELLFLMLTIWDFMPNRIFDDYDFLMKLFTVLNILAVAGTVATFVLAKFYSIKSDEMTEFTPSINLTCPRCLTRQDILVGESSCPQCRLKFKIEVEEPKCPSCGYFLRGLSSPVCPECGTQFAAPISQQRPAGSLS